MRRWSAIAGYIFVVFVIVARLLPGAVPDPENRDALVKFTRYYADSAHNNRAVIAVVVGFLGLLAFAWFVGGLWSLLRNAEAEATMPTIVVAVGGAAFVALGMMYHVLHDVVGVTLHFSDGYTLHKGFDPATALLLNEASRGAYLGAMLAVGAVTAAAGILILRTHALPAWLAWVGFVIAVLCLPTIPVLTLIAAVLLAIWTVITSTLMLRAETPAAPAA